jgi:uncharacterized protein YqhQ
MDFKKIFIKDACPTKVGGQAVMEGIMMKGEDRTSVVIRLPNGSQYIRTQGLKQRSKWYNVPILRGMFIFMDSLISGMRTLTYSAEVLSEHEEDAPATTDATSKDTITASENVAIADENNIIADENNVIADENNVIAGLTRNPPADGKRLWLEDRNDTPEDTPADAEEEGPFARWLIKRFGEKAPLTFALAIAVIISLAFTILIFIIGPTWVLGFLGKWVENGVALNLIEGAFRIVLFVVYIALVSRMKDIKTVFRYHGAEHKCIHCYESGLELTPANCKQFETLHPRCGTSFLMFVMVISLLLFSLLGWPNLLIRIASRLVLIPIIAGLSYELLRWAGSSTAKVVKILSVPGLLLQKLTTKEPDESELEVAITAMKAVLAPSDTPFYEGYCEDAPDGTLAQQS